MNNDVESHLRIYDDVKRRTWFITTIARVLPARRVHMASVVLASLVAQVMFYDYDVSGACWGTAVYLVQWPDNRYDVNCLDIRVICGRPYILGHLAAPVAAYMYLSPLMRDLSVEISG